ncbi:MAG TPA: hypothetical protein VHY35_06500 [Stellaceae bacterium]|nr:hypothetical protein [Stellaceae bacterium]
MDLGIDDRRRGSSFWARLRFGMRATQQYRPCSSQCRPGLQHGTPIDKPVLFGHFLLHGASETALFTR